MYFDELENELIQEKIHKIEDIKVKPGEKSDLRLSLEIHKLNSEFKAVNFGQTIDRDLINDRRPVGLEEYDKLIEYRKWK